MKKIKLTQGKFALVDDKDFDWLNQWNWNARKGQSDNFYAVRKVLKKQGEINDKSSSFRMHNLIMNPVEGFVIDHINHNTLDNRRGNLRVASLSQNMFNKKIYKNNTSGYKGVVWNKQTKKWRAIIRANLKRIHLGYFLYKKDAAKAYNAGAKKYHGEFALINNT